MADVLNLPPPMNAPNKKKRNNNRKPQGKPNYGKPQGQFIKIPPNARYIRGYGKYVEPQAVFQQGSNKNNAAHQRLKKKIYKKQAAESDSWWSRITKSLPDILTTAAPFVLKALSGFGDYKVNSNSILASATGGDNGSQLPMMENTKVSNVIRHREFIMNILGNTNDFFITTLPINPGLDTTFPWLFVIANAFTSYRMLGMVLEFKSLYSEFAAAGYLGYVAIGTQYNSLDVPFPDKQSLENSEYANSCKPTEDLLHPIECASDQQVLTHLYLRSGDIPNASDLKFYDLGKVSIATGGQLSSGIIGELWCTYEVEFYQPKLTRSTGVLINWDHWLSPDNATSALPFGATPAQSSGSTMVGSAMTGTTYQFPKDTTAGLYRWVWAIENAATAVIVAPLVTFANALGRAYYKLNTAVATYKCPADAVTSARLVMTGYVEITGPGAVIILGTAGTIPANSDMDFSISQIPTSISEEQKKLRKQGYCESKPIEQKLIEKPEIVQKTVPLSIAIRRVESIGFSKAVAMAIHDFVGGDFDSFKIYFKELQLFLDTGYPPTLIEDIASKSKTSIDEVVMELSWCNFSVVTAQHQLRQNVVNQQQSNYPRSYSFGSDHTQSR